MGQRILVIGATGLLGEPVANGLREAGCAVRMMSRDALRVRARFAEAFEVVAGDALNVGDVEKALADCEAVHVSIDHDQEDECVSQGRDEVMPTPKLQADLFLEWASGEKELKYYPEPEHCTVDFLDEVFPYIVDWLRRHLDQPEDHR